jgi:hypothetical protein
MIMFATNNDFRFKSGASVLNATMTKPEWTTSFQEILDMMGDMMHAVQTQALFKSAFAETEDVNIFQSQAAISLACSLYYWLKNAAVQFLKGNFDKTHAHRRIMCYCPFLLFVSKSIQKIKCI